MTRLTPFLRRHIGVLCCVMFVLALAAFGGMAMENMTHGHGWRFLEIGRRTERALVMLYELCRRRSFSRNISPNRARLRCHGSRSSGLSLMSLAIRLLAQ